jgi:hypothetical protein
MVNSVLDTLIIALLKWLVRTERTYDEVMDAWRTSCPKLPVWEVATDRGLVRAKAREWDRHRGDHCEGWGPP